MLILNLWTKSGDVNQILILARLLLLKHTTYYKLNSIAIFLSKA